MLRLNVKTKAGVSGSHRVCWIGLACAAALVAAGPVLGMHRQHHATTQVAWSPSNERLEVVHQVFAHDLEAVLIKLGAPGNITLEDVETRARAALYVAERFTLTGGESTDIALETLGAEVEGETLFVYQEAAIGGPPRELCANNTILFDLWSDQENVTVYDPDREAVGPTVSLLTKAGRTTRACGQPE